MCGVSFCTVCAKKSSSESTFLCPYHNATSTHHRINPWILFIDNDNQIKSLHLKEGILPTTAKHVTCKMKTNSQCCFTKKDAQSYFKRTIGFVKCDNPNLTVPLHFECFKHLILSKCDGKFIRRKNKDGIESILIACCKRCYNLMTRESPLMNTKQIKETSQPMANLEHKQKGKTSWTNDGTEHFLVEYLSDEVNASKYLGTKTRLKKMIISEMTMEVQSWQYVKLYRI